MQLFPESELVQSYVFPESLQSFHLLLNNLHQKIPEIQEPFLCELLTAADIQLDIECSDWRDAIIRSAQTLLDQGKIEDKYIDAMIDNVKENGAYIIISPEFAFTLK